MGKIIIDTDIGDDIDDALAFVYAINSKEIDIVGVTTVGSNPDKRAAIAKKLLAEYKYADIPVLAGAAQPIKSGSGGHWDNSYIPNQYGDEMKHIGTENGYTATDFIINTACENPQEITIVAIGPLTNVAQAIQKSQEFKQKVKRIILMGGAYTYHYNEFNIVLDPEAAKLVFDSGIPITAIGLEVCLNCSMEAKEIIKKLRHNGGPSSEFLGTLVERWDRVGVGRPVILFDVLTIAALINPGIFSFQKRLVKVETEGEYTRGMTFARETPFGELLTEEPNVQICKSVDVDELMNSFEKKVLGKRA